MAVSYCEMAINILFYINLYRVMQIYSYNCVCVCFNLLSLRFSFQLNLLSILTTDNFSIK